jgi:folate-binding protein YgfZ
MCAIRFSQLPDVAFIQVTGDDARRFLHGQLSQEILELKADRAPLAGWHDAKGRVRTLVRVLRSGDRWLLSLHRDMVDYTIQQLDRYVLGADVSLSPARDLVAAAILGDAREWLATHAVHLGAESGAAATAHEIDWIRMGPALVQMVSPKDRLALQAARLDEAAVSDADLAEIELGLPVVCRENSGRFLSQMLNLDLLDAVSFTKGCYPGQEIIARIHNLGEVKRRLRRFSAPVSAHPHIGMPLRNAAGDSVGEVVRHAQGGQRVEILAVAPLAAPADGLGLDDESRSPLHELALPYVR